MICRDGTGARSSGFGASSPLIAFLIIFFIQSIIGYYIYPAVVRAGV